MEDQLQEIAKDGISGKKLHEGLTVTEDEPCMNSRCW